MGRPRLPLVLLVLSLPSLLAGCRRPGASRPNVLLVTIDTLRADRVGCYGFPLARTPALDRLAAEGVRCTDVAAVAPITAVSHSSILTGLLPPAHGVRDNGTYTLGPDAVTLAERLRAAGWATHAIVSAVVLDRRYGLDQGFEAYDDDLWNEDAPKLFMIRDRPARKTADRFLAWLDSWQKEQPRRPFFAWVHLFDPHQPYRPEQIDRPLAPTLYDAEIATADRAVGRMVERLRAEGLLDDTLVVVTADHGESLGDHGEATHAVFVYDSTIRVPLLLRYPRLLRSGKTYTGPVSGVDLVPTVLAALGLPGGETTQGQDLLPFLRGEKPSPKGRVRYSESLLSEVGFGMAPLHAVRRDGLLYVRAPRAELYDTAKDPGQLTNLYDGERRRAALLDDALTGVMNDSAQHAVKAGLAPMSRETLESLRSLGYLAPASEAKSLSGMDPKDGLPFHRALENARHAMQAKKWEPAERLLRQILARLPANVSARNVLALSLLRQGRLAEAREEYARSLADDPNQARVLAMLGTIALIEGDLPGAEKAFRSALEMAPAFVEAAANLGFVAQLRGRPDEARSWYAKVAALDPGFPRGNRLSGDLWFERGEYGKALADYRKVLEARPDDFDSLLQAGSCQRRLGDVDGAAASFRRAGAARPDSWMPGYDLACLEAAGGRPAEALALLERELPGKAGVDLGLIRSDPDLEAVRRLPGFAALLARLGPADGDDAS